MKKMWMVMAAMIVVGLALSVSAVKLQAVCDEGTCICQFVDEDGDGICDLCGGCLPEGDGEPDQIRAKDGSGDNEPKGDGECDGDGPTQDKIQKKDGTGK